MAAQASACSLEKKVVFDLHGCPIYFTFAHKSVSARCSLHFLQASFLLLLIKPIPILRIFDFGIMWSKVAEFGLSGIRLIPFPQMWQFPNCLRKSFANKVCGIVIFLLLLNHAGRGWRTAVRRFKKQAQKMFYTACLP